MEQHDHAQIIGRHNTLGERLPEKDEEDSEVEMVYEKNEQRFVSNDAETGALVIAKAGPSGVQQISRLQMNERDLIRSNIIKTSIVLGQVSVKYT